MLPCEADFRMRYMLWHYPYYQTLGDCIISPGDIFTQLSIIAKKILWRRVTFCALGVLIRNVSRITN
jgi:hypothetical protein